MTTRGAFVRLHRWVGLAIAAFLIVSGLTGSAIAFYHELDEWLNPELFRVPSRGDIIPPLELAARIGAQEPQLRVTYVPLQVDPGHALVIGMAGRMNPATGEPYESRYVEVFVDPVTGERLGDRRWGACCVERKQLMPFLYAMHYSLHLPGLWGWWLMGGVALAWTVDCFVGFYLTLPGRRRRTDGKPAGGGPRSFWTRWQPAWKVNLAANPYRINFDLHRAAGLWAWALLFVLALSGAYLALTFEVFRPALAAVAAVTPSPFDPATARTPVDPGVSLERVVATAREEASRRGWQPPYDVFHSPEFGIFGVGLGDHHAPGLGTPYLYVDAATGRIRQELVPGQGTAADVFMQWMFPLHSGRLLGLPMRILVSLSGLVVAGLTVTGVVIWWKKWTGRRALAARARLSEGAAASAAA